MNPARVALVALVAFAMLPACSPSAPVRPPDIVLISLDSVRADDLTFRDEQAAPALAALARRGTVFGQCIAGSSWTLPGHAEMFTGSPPALNGVILDDVALDPLQPTLPELLAARGYRTAGFYSGGYLDPRYGFARGFASYEDCQTAAEDTALPGAGAEHGSNGISGPTVVARAEALLASCKPDEPLFLFAHVFDPHYDYIPPPPFDTRFDPDYHGDIDPRGYFHNPRIYDATRTPHRQVNDRDLQHLRALYRGEIAWTDSNVGHLLEALARHGRLDNAVIIVTSDHGEEFFEHGNRGHRNSLFDEVLRVPLLVVPPGGAAGRPAGCVADVHAQVSLSDIAPTLLDFAGAPAAASMSGLSLRGAAFGAGLPRRAIYSTLAVPSTDQGVPGLWLTESLRWPESKLVFSSRVEAGQPMRMAVSDLYDLAADPGERAPTPLQPGDPLLGQQWQSLESVLETLRARYAATRHTPDAARTIERSAAADENLRALGYLGTDGAPPAPLRPPWGLGPHPRFAIK